jgi:hypothetical protein
MLLNLEGFKYATSLDLNMGYYHIKLSPDSKKLCTLITPFGKYEMQKLPMGLCNSNKKFPLSNHQVCNFLQAAVAGTTQLCIGIPDMEYQQQKQPLCF